MPHSDVQTNPYSLCSNVSSYFYFIVYHPSSAVLTYNTLIDEGKRIQNYLVPNTETNKRLFLTKIVNRQMSSTKQFVKVYPKSVYEQFKQSLCRFFFKIENSNDRETHFKFVARLKYSLVLNIPSTSFQGRAFLSPILNEWCTECCVVFKSKIQKKIWTWAFTNQVAMQEARRGVGANHHLHFTNFTTR